MFTRTPRLSTRGEEEKLLGRTSHHELANRSAVSPSPTTPSQGPVSPQATSPLSAAIHHPHYLGSYETLVRRQSLNEKKPLAADKPKDNTPPVLASPFNPGAATDSRPAVINDPFTGEPKAVLSPDHDDPIGPSWSMFEDCAADSAMQDTFWSHVAKIRELQSEVAKMHIAMESIGQPVAPQPSKEKEKDKHKEPRKFRGQTPSSARSGTTSTVVNTDRDDTGHSASDTDHGGSGRESRTGAKKSTSTESPVATDTGEHFAERKEAIQNIMKKLTSLSQQVSEFHQLPTPEITFPTSPSRQPLLQPQSPPQTPPQPATLAISSPSHPAQAHQVRSKPGQVQRHSPLGPHGNPVRISIPVDAVLASGAHTQPVTPSKTKPHSATSGDGTVLESPISIQQAHHP